MNEGLVARYITRGKNLDILEGVLERTSHEYEQLQLHKKGIVDLGPELTQEGLLEIFPEVDKATQDFLGIKHIPPVELSLYKNSHWSELPIFFPTSMIVAAEAIIGRPSSIIPTLGTAAIVYGVSRIPPLHRWVELTTRTKRGSEYDCDDNRLLIAERRVIPAIGTIAHELTHHIHHHTGGIVIITDPLVEGPALGVENAVSHVFAQRYDNPAYLLDSVETMAGRIKHAYQLACATLGKAPENFLEGVKDKGGFHGHHYCLGAAAISIAETKHGRGVYKKIFNHDYRFLDK